MASSINISLGAFLQMIMVVALWSLRAHSQEVSPTITMDRQQILIGEQVSLDLKLRLPAKDTAIWPIITDTITKNIEVVSAGKIDTSYDRNDISIKYLFQRLKLTSFDSGYFAIPPFQFKVAGNSYETEPLLLEVQTVPIDTAKGIADIKGPIGMDFTFADWLRVYWPWLAGGMAILGAISLIAYLISKRKQGETTPLFKPKPKRAAHFIALDKLDELKQRKLWQNNKVKLYHSELTDILREYLENRFYVNALEQTTEEIMYSVRKVDLGDENRARLRQMLMLSDLVKFAKETPISGENENSMNVGYQIVNSTIPRSEETKEEEELETIKG